MRVLGLLLLVAALLGLMALGYWAYLTSSIGQPYDEMWIALNAPLPEPLRAWACGAVQDRLGLQGSVPPHGCQGLWGEGA